MPLKSGSIGGMNKGVRLLLPFHAHWDATSTRSHSLLLLLSAMTMKRTAISHIPRYIQDIRCCRRSAETALLSDSRAETLLKAGQYPMLRYYLYHSFNIGEYWASIKICIRNGYTIEDGSMWRDTIDLLRHFGKDTNSPKYVCPADLKVEHDKLVAKRNLQRKHERTEQQRRKAIEDEKQYLKAKGIFFGLAFTDSLICVKVIESVEEMAEEGRTMHHCVGGYHKRKDSLILSATIDGKRIETIEVSLKTFEVVQCRGVCNENSEYHDRIIALVNKNANLIRQRMKAA